MKKKIVAIIFCAISFFVSYDAKSQNKSKLEDWHDKIIILPSAKLLRSDNKEYTNPLSKKIKILTVINGSCTVCIDELKKWKTYMQKVDTSQVGFIYLIQSEDDLFTFKKLNKDYFKLSYPYFYDIKNKISKANNITDNKAYHTFLLNNNNEVILVGNPNKNKQLFKQYNSEINKRIKKKKPTVVVKEGVNETTFKISEGFVYKDQDGNLLSPSDVQKVILNHKFVPHIDIEKNVVIFKER